MKPVPRELVKRERERAREKERARGGSFRHRDNAYLDAGIKRELPLFFHSVSLRSRGSHSARVYPAAHKPELSGEKKELKWKSWRARKKRAPLFQFDPRMQSRDKDFRRFSVSVHQTLFLQINNIDLQIYIPYMLKKYY